MLMLSPVKIQYTQINTNIYGTFLLTLFLWAHTDGKGYRGVLLIRLYREIKKPHLSALGKVRIRWLFVFWIVIQQTVYGIVVS